MGYIFVLGKNEKTFGKNEGGTQPIRVLLQDDLAQIMCPYMNLEFHEHPNFLSFRNSLCVARGVSFTTIYVNIRSFLKHLDQLKFITASVRNVVDTFGLKKLPLRKNI